MGQQVADAPSVTRLLHALDHGDHLVRRTGRMRPDLKMAPAFGPIGTVLASGDIDNLQAMAGPDQGWVSIVVDQYGDTILSGKSDKPIYILSDPDFLNNHGLAQLANARAASALINYLRKNQKPVAFDLTLAGFVRTRSILRLALEPPFLAATLCALVAAGLMGLHAVARFGPALRPARAFALGKLALADNSAALIRQARRQHRMGRGYAALTRTPAARAVGAPRDLDDDQLDGLLDRLGQGQGATPAFSQLEQSARETGNVAGPHDGGA